MCALYIAAASAAISQVVVAGDGVFLGLTTACVAVCSFIGFRASAAALAKIRDAPFVQVADLRSIASLADGEQILVVRGTVESKFVAESNPVFRFLLRTLIPRSLIPHAPVAELSKREGVIYQKMQRFVYNGWTSELRSMLEEDENGFSSTTRVPFVLTPGLPLKSDYVIVNMDGSKHPLPLAQVYHELQPTSSSKYTLLHALFGHEDPVGILNQEKILPLWQDITAVGYVSLKDGRVEIKSCKDLPYFLSDYTSKDEMLEDLNLEVKVLLWSGIVFGSFAICILSYAAMRNWGRWKEWKEWLAPEQNLDEADREEELKHGVEEPPEVEEGMEHGNNEAPPEVEEGMEHGNNEAPPEVEEELEHGDDKGHFGISCSLANKCQICQYH